MLRGHRDLKVFQLAYKLAMRIFRESRTFPKEERFRLLPSAFRLLILHTHDVVAAVYVQDFASHAARHIR